MRKNLLISLIFSFTIPLAQAGVLTLTGSYKGQNLVLQNPYNSLDKTFCIVSIYVNKTKLSSNPRTTAVEVKLTELGIEVGEPIELKIIYRKGSKPSIINPQAIKSNHGFKFTDIKISHKSYFWETHGETKDGNFEIEQYNGDRWVVLEVIQARGNKSDNLYEIPSEHHTGENKYRFVYVDNGEKTYSHEYIYKSTQLPVTFHPKKVIDLIYFYSDNPVYYQIFNKHDELVMEGKSKSIDCGELEAPAKYKIYYDNQYDDFSIKKRKE